MVTAPSSVDVCALCTHSPDLSLHDGFVFSAYRSHADSFVSLPCLCIRYLMDEQTENEKNEKGPRTDTAEISSEVACKRKLC